MTTYPSVAVVILNWNGKSYLEKFLHSVLNSNYPVLEIIVADNASSDDSVEFVKKNFPSIKVIRNAANLGFAGGYNQALNQVNSDYFVLLNSDVEVEPNWIKPVIQLMETNPLIAAAQPKIKNYNRKDFFEYAGAAGGFLDIYGYPFCRGRIFDTVEQDNGQYNRSREVFWASGAACFIKKSAWIEAGGLDAEFFAHMEEIDLCWRLKNLGYKIMYCADSTVYHIGGGTLTKENPKKTFLNFRNNLIMLQKNLPQERAFFIILIRFCLDFISLIKFAFEGKFKNAWAISKAHFAFLKSLSSTNKKRIFDFSRYNEAGLLRESIVWKYFVQNKKKWSDL